MFYGIGEAPIPFRVSSRAIYHIIFSIIPDIKDFFIIAKFNSYFFHVAFSFSPSGRWDSLFDLNSYSHKPTNSFRITECNPVFTAYRLHVRIPFFFVILKSLRFLFF